jgi:hypothetical protein
MVEPVAKPKKPGLNEVAILAKRIDETLHVETFEGLKTVLHEKGAMPVAGIGPPRLAILRATSGNMLIRIRAVFIGPADEPSVNILLDVDREYRQKAVPTGYARSHPGDSIQAVRHGFRSCIPQQLAFCRAVFQYRARP